MSILIHWSGPALEDLKGSRPNSVLSAGELSPDNSEVASPPGGTGSGTPAQPSTITLQTVSTAPLATVYEFPPSPVKEVFSYSKGVQTNEPWSASPRKSRDAFSESDEEPSPSKNRTPKSGKRLSRRERDREEEIRLNIRREIEEELRAVKGSGADRPLLASSQERQGFPARTLTTEELNAVTSSEDFLEFVERSSKVIERALDEEYDVLADYALRGLRGDDEDDDGVGGTRGKAGRRVKEHVQFYDERWSKKRMISDLGFSPKVRVLLPDKGVV
jgi:dynein intermediate chain